MVISDSGLLFRATFWP